MSIEFKLPDLGEGVESGDLVAIRVSEGDLVEKDQSVLEIETNKATVDLPIPFSGTIEKIHVSEGDNLPVGAILFTVSEGNAGQVVVEPAQEEVIEEKQPEPAPVVAQPAKTSSEPVLVEKPITIPAGPATRKLARELDIDLNYVTGSGPGGRITREDVQQVSMGSVAGASASSALKLSCQTLKNGERSRKSHSARCVRKQLNICPSRGRRFLMSLNLIKPT